MRRLIEHVLALPEDAIPSLTIQDAAICHVWLTNGGPDVESVEGSGDLQARLRQWLAAAVGRPHLSEARRCQTLLRELINRAQSDDVDSMTRDELDLLESVHSFAHAAQHHNSFERVRRLIAPRRARIAARRTKLPPAAGLPALSKRLLVVRQEDILEAAHREVRILAGIEIPARGPVLIHTGHLRVLGDVPDGATVVVEEADCVVDGYVMGRVAVSGHCEVLENISGVVISRNGDVRARNILENATVVAKRGRIQCRRIHGARMVFAGDALFVAETCIRSQAFAPTVKIGGAIESGRIHASRSVVAESMGGDDAPLDVYLRRGLSCKDYGENPGRTMSADVGRALRARSNLQGAQAHLSLEIRATEQSAETCLMYLLASDDAGHAAEDVLTAQRRLDVLNRIMLGLRSVYAEAESHTEEDGDDGDQKDTGEARVLERIDAELAAMMEDVPEADPVRAMYDDLQKSWGEVREKRRKRTLLKYTLDETVAKLERWHREADRLRETIRRGQETLARSGRVKEFLGADAQSRSKIAMLQRVLARAKAEKPGSALRARSESAFLAKMMRTIDKRLADARTLNGELVALRAEFVQAQQHVLNQYQMRIDEDDGIDRRIFVEGAFTGAVRIHYDPRYVSDATPESGADSAYRVAHSNGERVRYSCSGGQIHAEPIPEDDVAMEPELAIG